MKAEAKRLVKIVTTPQELREVADALEAEYWRYKNACNNPYRQADAPPPRLQAHAVQAGGCEVQFSLDLERQESGEVAT